MYFSGEALWRLDDVSYHVVPAPGLRNCDWDKRHISCPSFRVPRQHNCNLQANHLQHIFQEIVPSNSWMSVEKSREESLQPTCDKFQLYWWNTDEMWPWILFEHTNLVHLLMNKGHNFLKKLWCCVGGSITRQFGFINWVDNVNWPP